MRYSPEGEPQHKAPDYDWEDFRSFLLSFRQISLNVSEPVYITTIRNIIARYADPKYHDDLRVIKKHLAAILSGKRNVGMMHMKTDEGLVELSGAALLDALVNGELFHSDADYEKILHQLRSVPSGSYVWFVLFDVIMPVLHASSHLVNVILWSNLLQRDELPDRLRGVWDTLRQEHPPASHDKRSEESQSAARK
jgi:hypothetical protein